LSAVAVALLLALPPSPWPPPCPWAQVGPAKLVALHSWYLSSATLTVIDQTPSTALVRVGVRVGARVRKGWGLGLGLGFGWGQG
jgi:hypothetical protein